MGKEESCLHLGNPHGPYTSFYQRQNSQNSNHIAFIVWQIVLLVFFSVIYAPYNTSLLTWKRVAEGGRSMTTLQRFWYSSTHLLWSSALTWLVFACCRGLGGPITQLLTWPGWTPISKVSFMTYLVHMDFNWIFFFMQVII